MTAKTPPRSEKQDAGYAAVVYVHGMGSQRRLEETSRLIDAVDRFLGNAYRQRGEALGMLSKIKPRVEPSRTRDGDTVTYIRSLFKRMRGKGQVDTDEVRYYEAYWAPLMASAGSTAGVARWILRQILRPWQTLRTRWRERQRLRRAALAELHEMRSRWPAGVTAKDFDRLLYRYANFDSLASKRRHAEGTFDEFLSYIDQQEKGRERTERLHTLARAWRAHYVDNELRTAFLLLTVLVGLLVSGGLLLWSSWQLLSLLSSADVPSSSNPTLESVLGLASGFALFVLGGFLKDALGDVEAWSTYEESNDKHVRRRDVLALTADTLQHVLMDRRCRRVVVVGHSLGSSIAHDALLHLARQNRAVNSQDPISGPVPLTKIRHFITLGSPIDKINYFFESYRTPYHRYARTVETLRGDINDVPFARNRTPYIHWVNYWDAADPVSGALQSPVGRKSLSPRVDNVQVASLRFPAPAAAHAAYFADRMVVRQMFEMICLDRYNFEHLPTPQDGRGYDYESMMLGPGGGAAATGEYQRVGLAIPWLALVGAVAGLAGATGWAVLALGVAAFFAVIIFVDHRVLGGQQDPL